VERKTKYKLIYELITTLPGKRNKGVFTFGFETFKKIFNNNNFSSINELEKASLFRECYSLGKGEVTPDIFFTVMQEREIFTK